MTISLRKIYMMQMDECIFWATKCHSLRRVLLQILADLQRAAGLSQYRFHAPRAVPRTQTNFY